MSGKWCNNKRTSIQGYSPKSKWMPASVAVGCKPVRARPTLANRTVCPNWIWSVHACKQTPGRCVLHRGQEMNALSLCSSLFCFHCSWSSYFPSPTCFSLVASPFFVNWDYRLLCSWRLWGDLFWEKIRSQPKWTNFGLNSVKFRDLKHKIHFRPDRNGQNLPKFGLSRSNPRSLLLMTWNRDVYMDVGALRHRVALGKP